MIWALGVIGLIFIVQLLRDERGPEQLHEYLAGDVRREVSARAAIKKIEKDYRKNYVQIGWEEFRKTYYHPEDPVNFERKLYAPRAMVFRKLLMALVIIHACIIASFILVYQPRLTLTTDKGSILAEALLLTAMVGVISIVPVGLWFRRKIYWDARTKGYLEGYMDAHQYILDKREEEPIDDAKHDEFDNMPPFAHYRISE